eukprot:5464345-Amphidinium_carterae.1
MFRSLRLSEKTPHPPPKGKIRLLRRAFCVKPEFSAPSFTKEVLIFSSESEETGMERMRLLRLSCYVCSR